MLFNEIEKEADLRLPEPKAEKACPVRKIKRKGKKDAFISALRKTDPVEYVLTEEEQLCPVCGHKLHEMTKRIHREVEIFRPKAVVREHISIYTAAGTVKKRNRSYDHRLSNDEISASWKHSVTVTWCIRHNKEI